MPSFEVQVTIENKPQISDPEGATILKDLLVRGSYKSVSKIRTAKTLKFTVTEETKKSAEARVREICEELRIYNPLVSGIAVRVFDAQL